MPISVYRHAEKEFSFRAVLFADCLKVGTFAKRMLTRLQTIPLLLRNMGWRAFRFRAGYELRKRTGWLKRRFPTNVAAPFRVTLAQWQAESGRFFFESKRELPPPPALPPEAVAHLQAEIDQMKGGHYLFFNAFYLSLGQNDTWQTNPDTRFRYNPQQHWTEINDLDPQNGDIKYVWEKSRFTFLYPLIRYDYFTGQDQADLVLNQLQDWLAHNPLNCGPNYVCSQEISLRLLNWTFALHYYKHSPCLTEEVFGTIIQSIYWQAKHVAANIHFSRIAVRNNHAITECLCLYLIGLLYPFFPESAAWRKQGKRWLEEEGLYQIYPDGSYLQFSTNYHRVVIQLFTWAFFLAEANGDRFTEKLYERLQQSLHLLHQLQDQETGQLPNYGANDGALFFRLNTCTYRDFRPQLNALHYFFKRKPLYETGPWQEDLLWYGQGIPQKDKPQPVPQSSAGYSRGGFYVLRDPDKFAFIRCGNHPDRPSQADNLHLDLWLNGMNLLRDAGSYKYNTTPELLRFFMGTASHNTVQLGDYDQMQKGGRFIWYHWSQAVRGDIVEEDEWILFKGTAHVYRHLHQSIYHTRQVKQHKKMPRWEIEDQLSLPDIPALRGLVKKQLWHPHPQFFEMGFRLEASDEAGSQLSAHTREVWYSPCYGLKEPVPQVRFEQIGNYFHTVISR